MSLLEGRGERRALLLDEWAGLAPGMVRVEMHEPAEAFIRNAVLVVARIDCRPWGEWAGTLQVPRSVMDDDAGFAQAVLWRLDRYVRPWAYSDRDPWPEVVLFPRIRRWELRWRALRRWVRWRWWRLRRLNAEAKAAWLGRRR